MKRALHAPPTTVPARVLLPTTPAFLHLQARRRRLEGGLIFQARRIPFGELHDAAERMAHQLAGFGVGAGTHVALLAGNQPSLVTLMYAAWALGAVVVPIAARSTAAEVGFQLDAARIDVLVCDVERGDIAREAARSATVPAYVCAAAGGERLRTLRRGVRRRRRPRAPRAEDLAVITYTSGTTGTPKGVMLTHGNLLWAALSCGTARGDTGQSVGSCISPLTHVPVFVSHLLCRLLHGSTAVLIEKFSVSALLQALERDRLTDLTLIAGMVFDVAAHGSVPARVRRSLRKVSVGGAATPMGAKEQLAAMFPDAEIIEAYGQSESTDGLAMARGRSVFERPGTVGRANPFVLLHVRRGDGSIAGMEEEGELVAGGPTIMQGYYRDRAATAAVWDGTWLRTGDLGRCDADGYLYVTGRAKELIISGGENVSPAEVEAILRAHPQVADVAVVGTPHPRWGEQVTAVVVPRAGAEPTVEALRTYAAHRLAAHKVPRRIEFARSLPRTPSNKVHTERLKQQLQ